MTTPVPPVDPVADYTERLARSHENLPLGVLAGLVAAVAGAIGWAAITEASGYQIGFMAIGIGWVVGFSVRAAGRGSSPPFQFVGGFFALFGCALGNLLVACVYLAQANEVGVTRVFEVLDPMLAMGLMIAMFSPIDLLFYGLAVFEGVRLAKAEEAPEPPAA